MKKSTLSTLVENFEKAEESLQMGLKEHAGKTCFFRGVPHKVQERKSKSGVQYYLRCLMSKEAMRAIDSEGQTFAAKKTKKTG